MNKKLSLLASFFTLTSTLIPFTMVQKAEAASCTFPTNLVVAPSGSSFTSHSASNLAFASYYLDYSFSGDFAPFGFNFEALPGFRQQNRKGFIGTSANLYTSFFVLPTIPSGRSVTVTERIFSVTGATVCQGSFTITVQ